MRLPPRLLLLVALSVGAGYLLGRSLGWPPAINAPPRPGAGAPAVTHVPVFSLPDLDGRSRSITEWTADTLIINFWATWCAPCRAEMPLLEQLHRERAGSGFAIIGIAIDRADPVRTFLAETGVTYPILVGQQDAMAVAESFGPQFVGLPLSVVSLPGGEILHVHLGELHPEELRAILDATDRVNRRQLTVEQGRTLLGEELKTAVWR
jgi:thiol-disulfide isomerase/thioredoxin